MDIIKTKIRFPKRGEKYIKKDGLYLVVKNSEPGKDLGWKIFLNRYSKIHLSYKDFLRCIEKRQSNVKSVAEFLNPKLSSVYAFNKVKKAFENCLKPSYYETIINICWYIGIDLEIFFTYNMWYLHADTYDIYRQNIDKIEKNKACYFTRGDLDYVKSHRKRYLDEIDLFINDMECIQDYLNF